MSSRGKLPPIDWTPPAGKPKGEAHLKLVAGKRRPDTGTSIIETPGEVLASTVFYGKLIICTEDGPFWWDHVGRRWHRITFEGPPCGD